MNSGCPASGKRRLPRFFIVALLAGAFFAPNRLPAQIDFTDPPLPEGSARESLSPVESLPGLREPGLSARAVPSPSRQSNPERRAFVPLFRLTRPFYDDPQAPRPPDYLPSPAFAGFRPVISYEPDLGLHPRSYRDGLFEIYPWFGLAQSFDSNVNLTSTDQIADFFITPRAGVEFQLGTPDTVARGEYDTILALNGSVEAFADIFYENPEFSAFNVATDLQGRIGRDAAIWRPFVTFSDITGSSLLITEFTNRTRRLRLLPGLTSQYQFTELFGMNQTLSYFWFDHTDPSYINFQSWRAQEELTYRILHDTDVLLWTEYRRTVPDQGSSGDEIFAGLGWQGRPDPRIFTKAYIGWDFVMLSGNVPGRSSLPGLRFNGYTTFDWTPRVRLTFKYDRDYIFNETDVNDNYTSTLFQFRTEFYLGSNWYVTPYFGVALLDYETSRRMLLQWRPELEVSYALAQNLLPNDPRIFIKVGYQSMDVLKGEGGSIPDWRISIGTNWKF